MEAFAPLKIAMDVKQLEDVLFRLSVTKDESFAGVIFKLLPRLLLALTPANWASVSIRTKIVQIFSHVNKRIKAIPSVILPCQQILDVVIGCSGQQKKSQKSEEADGINEEDEEDDEDDDEIKRRKKRDHLPPPNAIRTNFGMVYMTLH